MGHIPRVAHGNHGVVKEAEVTTSVDRDERSAEDEGERPEGEQGSDQDHDEMWSGPRCYGLWVALSLRGSPAIRRQHRPGAAHSYCARRRSSISIAASAERSLFDCRSPCQTCSSAVSPSRVLRAIHVSPTGLPGRPPVGPAMPVTDRPTSAPSLWRAPRALSLAASR